MTGDADTFVFLVDMHQLFEDYTHAILQTCFRVAVEKQVVVGYLFKRFPGGLQQRVDFRWIGEGGLVWLGDAKYKHLSRRGKGIITPCLLDEPDIRQLTVYAELQKNRTGSGKPPSIMVLFPFVGESSEFTAANEIAWNDSDFWLVPVKVRQCDSLVDCMPMEAIDAVVERQAENPQHFGALADINL